jgi:hypothetical protein
VAKLFGFVQFEIAGRLPLAEGRYLAGSADGSVEDEWVLVVKTTAAPAAPERRRRRRVRGAPTEAEAMPLPLTRVMAIRASSPLESPADAARWLDEACEADDAAAALVTEAISPLNRALHAHAVAAADPHGRELAPEAAERVLIGYGSGEDAADGRFSDAREVDLAPRTSSRRRRREEQLRPQERLAGVLRGRERLDACETLLLRARADLDGGRAREAALQLRAGLEALLVELQGAVDDPGHAEDMAELQERQAEAARAAEAATHGNLGDEDQAAVEGLLPICERVLRRRRVLRG